MKRYAAKAAKLMQSDVPHAHGHGPLESVRTADHNGHRIAVHTQYRVEVDGKPLDVQLSVDLDGQVTCHAVPSYSYPSAVDMVKQLIDTFPDDFARKTRRPKGSGEVDVHDHAAAATPAAHGSGRKGRPARKG